MLRTLQPGQTAVDVGAHKGAFTYWMQSAVGTEGRVYSFEPQPELAKYLQQMKAAFRFSQVSVIDAAVSSQPGTMWLHRPQNGPSPGASLTPSPRGNGVSVPVLSLDEFFADRTRQPIHFIKCDVEGHELSVFQGGESILTTDRPVLLFECERRHHLNNQIDSVFQYLQSLNYDGFFFTRRSMKPLEAFDPSANQDPVSSDYVYNFSFVPRRLVCGNGRRSAYLNQGQR